jgi:small-conductance mechanosensitive channel
MERRRTILALLIIVSLSLWLIYYLQRNTVFARAALTMAVLAIIYFVFNFILNERIINKIEISERRYYLSKASWVGYVLVIIITISIIWVENIQGLLFGFGLVAAAFTISLQDVARNFAGGTTIFWSGLYRVGDRIEINSKKGDVIDIGILYTTVMENNEWVSGDQPTGRISVIPNSFILNNVLDNYTKGFSFLWDEITVPITYDSDWRAARSLILDIIRAETELVKDLADEEIMHLQRRYYISRRSIEADLFMKFTDNWIELTARYVVYARQRRTVKSKLSQRILEGIESSENIKVASQTFDIVGFPELSVEEKGEKAEKEENGEKAHVDR